MTDEVAGAGAAQQLPAEPGAVGARAARARAAHRIPEPDPRAGTRRTSRIAPSNSCRATTRFAERRKQRLGLTRPELAVVLAYSKIWLSNHLLDSDLPDDPYFASEVQRYFPTPMRKRYAREIPRHRLRREIVATAHHQQPRQPHGAGVRGARAGRNRRQPGGDRARLHHRARDLLDALAVGRHRSARQRGRRERAVRHVLSHRPAAAAHELLAAARARQATCTSKTPCASCAPASNSSTDGGDLGLGGERRAAGRHARGAHGERRSGKTRAPGRAAVAARTRARHRRAGARANACPWRTWRASYFELGVTLGLDWLHGEIDRLAVDGPWQATARTGLRDAAMRAHRELTQQVLRARRGARRRTRRALERAAQRRARELEAHARPRCARSAPPTSPRSRWASMRCATSSSV